MNVRVGEHSGISPLTGKKSKARKTTAVKDHMLRRSRIKTLENDFNTRKRKLRGILGIIDYTHVCCLFLNKNDKKLKSQQDIQDTLRSFLI